MSDTPTNDIKTPFLNPYENSINPRRLVSNLDKDEFEFIYCIRPIKGTLQTVTNLLWNKLVNELKRNGITSVQQQEQFERFVGKCRIVVDVDQPDENTRNDLQRSTVTGSMRPVQTSNAVRRTAEAGAGNTEIKNKPTVVKGGTRKTKSRD